MMNMQYISSQNFNGWIESSNPEQDVPVLWSDEKPLTSIGVAMHELLVTQAFRPDRVIAKALQVVSAVLGNNFLAEAEVELDLATIVENEVIYFYLFIIALSMDTVLNLF